MINNVGLDMLNYPLSLQLYSITPSLPHWVFSVSPNSTVLVLGRGEGRGRSGGGGGGGVSMIGQPSYLVS